LEFHYNDHIHLSYDRYPGSDRILILFHGFGLNKKAFEPWVEILRGDYTLYALDLFYHGDSEKPLGVLTKKDWTLMFTAFLAHEGIERFEVLGFSLGARFAICSAIEIPEKCDHLFLVAPDAVYLTPWFRLATSPVIKQLFKYFMLHPRQMDAFLAFCVKWKWVNPYVSDFVSRELGKPENRKRVYISWNHFKPLGYRARRLQKAFKKASYEKTLILGTRDIVIPPQKILPILKDCGFEWLQLPLKHHQLIKEEVARYIKKYI
jgi:pimeloyl-ACP methyl ester carboxylesterase